MIHFMAMLYLRLFHWTRFMVDFIYVIDSGIVSLDRQFRVNCIGNWHEIIKLMGSTYTLNLLNGQLDILVAAILLTRHFSSVKMSSRLCNNFYVTKKSTRHFNCAKMSCRLFSNFYDAKNLTWHFCSAKLSSRHFNSAKMSTRLFLRLLATSKLLKS